MNSVKTIERLLEKYFEGETSLQEEMQLQEFFQREDVPSHLESYRSQFELPQILSTQTASIKDEQLFAKIESEAKVVEMKPQVFRNFTITRVAAAAALLIIGFWSGNQLLNNKMNAVETELAEMKALMMEQLENSSASGRMQAVSNSVQISERDDETIEILIAVMKNDASMHVRTKAIEALQEIGDKQKVIKAYGEALLEEQEPMVQIALIESLIQMNDKASLGHLEELTNKENVLTDVKEEAFLGIFKLKEL